MTPSRMLRILIADDEDIVHITIGSLLKEFGHHTEGEWNGVSALEAIRSQSFDLALVDVRMPGLDGLSLLSKAKEIKPDMEVIIMTGHGDPLMSKQAKEKGALAFLTKPISLKDLIEIIENL